MKHRLIGRIAIVVAAGLALGLLVAARGVLPGSVGAPNLEGRLTYTVAGNIWL